jgi:hypothetical protein
MARGNASVEAKSAKHAKFRELAQARTNRALDSIGRLGNLSNRHLYEWEDAEVKKVIRALRSAVSDIEARFTSPKGRSDAKFKL